MIPQVITLRNFHNSIFLLLVLLLLPMMLAAQKNLLRNGSFEDTALYSTPPVEWLDYGFPGESPVDIHPSGAFNVTKEAHHGKTYLGMVVRDNDTWEAICQRLDQPLEAQKTYQFTASLARSEIYISVSKKTEQRANYNTAVLVRIWGGDAKKPKELFYTSAPIIRSRWQSLEFEFTPTQEHTHFYLEAFHDSNAIEKSPYNGNVLIDQAILVEKEK